MPLAGFPLINEYITSLYAANYTEGRCYPTLAAGKSITSGINWTLGEFTNIVPLNAITNAYHVSAIVIESSDRDGVYELAVYHGTLHTLMATYRFAQSQGYFGNMAYLLPSVKLEANEQIDAKLAISGAVAGTLTISVVYRLISEVLGD
jgi:hypothetical protein